MYKHWIRFLPNPEPFIQYAIEMENLHSLLDAIKSNLDEARDFNILRQQIQEVSTTILFKDGQYKNIVHPENTLNDIRIARRKAVTYNRKQVLINNT